MHLLALVENPDHVCCRYRVEAFRPCMACAGHRLELRPFPRSWWEWLQAGRDLHQADAVLLQRRLLPPWPRYLLRRSARRLLFDFDDAVFLRDSHSPKGLYSRRRHRRFTATVRAADAVIAGNDFLAAAARRHTDARRVHVVPTCVEPARYPLAEHTRRGAGVELVWIGSSSTLQGLERIRPHLRAVGTAHPGVYLKLICDRFLEIPPLRVLRMPWSAAQEATELAAADVGISWVPDDDWSRGKCGLKVLQYMAAGLPVVANPVGVQAAMVRHGETGFLATTPDDWVRAVGTLSRDPDLRRWMGRAGRRLVETEYSVAAGANRWRHLLDRLEPGRDAA